MAVRFMKRGREWQTMTGTDVEICMHHANGIDPTRGQAWLDAFEVKAAELGYSTRYEVECVCSPQAGSHAAACQLAKPLPKDAGLVWPHDTEGMHPAALLITSDRLPSYDPHAVGQPEPHLDDGGPVDEMPDKPRRRRLALVPADMDMPESDPDTIDPTDNFSGGE